MAGFITIYIENENIDNKIALFCVTPCGVSKRDLFWNAWPELSGNKLSAPHDFAVFPVFFEEVHNAKKRFKRKVIKQYFQQDNCQFLL